MADVEIQILRESFGAVFIEMFYKGADDGDTPGPMTLLAKGSGFFYRVDGSDYLITARHCLNGRQWKTDEWLSTNHPGVEPTHVRVSVREKPPEGGYTSTTPVRVGHMVFRTIDDDDRPCWLEHARYGSDLDVVALPISIPDGILAIPWEPETEALPLGPALAKFWIAQDVSVVGFPYGMMGGFDLPLWIRGTIASEPEIPYPVDGQDLPLFLIDARTRTGQSGSPVLLVQQPNTPIPRGDGQMGISKAPISRLIGVYTGRIHKESDLGFVWRIEAVESICRDGVRPGVNGATDAEGDSALPTGS